MSHIKGLSNLEYEMNPDYMEDWLRVIGSYMLNFANIELVSYKYLNVLEKTEDNFLENTTKLLSNRINRIQQLLNGSTIDEKEKISDLWDNVNVLSKWRNRIAHNPVLPAWKPGSDSNKSPPDVLGITDIRQLSKESKITDSISLEGLKKLNTETVNVAKLLLDHSKNLINA